MQTKSNAVETPGVSHLRIESFLSLRRIARIFKENTVSTFNKTSTQNHAAATAHAKDAIDLLTADHKTVMQLFEEFRVLHENVGDISRKTRLVEKISRELTVHTQIEEEIFYPAVRDAIRDDRLMDDAQQEHAGAKQLIARLAELPPDDEDYDATVNALRDEVEHHVSDEQDNMFPKVLRSGLDTMALGEQLMQRKGMLSDELSGVKPA